MPFAIEANAGDIVRGRLTQSGTRDGAVDLLGGDHPQPQAHGVGIGHQLHEGLAIEIEAARRLRHDAGERMRTLDVAALRKILPAGAKIGVDHRIGMRRLHRGAIGNGGGDRVLHDARHQGAVGIEPPHAARSRRAGGERLRGRRVHLVVPRPLSRAAGNIVGAAESRRRRSCRAGEPSHHDPAPATAVADCFEAPASAVRPNIRRGGDLPVPIVAPACPGDI